MTQVPGLDPQPRGMCWLAFQFFVRNGPRVERGRFDLVSFVRTWLATFHAISRRDAGKRDNFFPFPFSPRSRLDGRKERSHPTRFSRARSTLCSIVARSLPSPTEIKIEGIAKSKEMHAGGGAPFLCVPIDFLPSFHSRCNLVLLRRERMNFDMGSGTWFFSPFSLLLYARYMVYVLSRFSIFLLLPRKWRDPMKLRT